MPTAYAAPTKDLLLFGGEDHRTFLGCLTCSKYDADSVFNTYGLHGSRYATDSIFNHYGEFGSRYSDYSACSRYASDPPVIIDRDGAFYGRLTINHYAPNATKNEDLIIWLTEEVCQ
jgi:hypothetical protein